MGPIMREGTEYDAVADLEHVEEMHKLTSENGLELRRGRKASHAAFMTSAPF